MPVTSYKERLMSQPQYRRRTVSTVPSMVYSVPNSARSLYTPRPSSALDRRWVHLSQGDLTLDMDLQIHPRLQSDFYFDLYQRYPQAFHRRLEAREAGRRLFNNRPHVKFKDDTNEFSSPSHIVSNGVGHLHGSQNHLTNWDQEVGHYVKHRRRSRECLTSFEPSEYSESELSVKQRLRLNSQSLNKLLNEQSPFRKHFSRDNVQYDSDTENELESKQSLEQYMLEKSKERSRHRKQQRKIIVQRKIQSDKERALEENKENELKKRRWMSKSASPTRRHLIQYSLPRMDYGIVKQESHHVDVDALIADSDLKVDTLLEQMSNKMSSPESPPDSAIEVGTPSVQSFVQGGNSKRTENIPDALPDTESCQPGPDEDKDIESSPGSSASSRAVKTYAGVDNDLHQEIDEQTMQSATLIGAIQSDDIIDEIDPASEEMDKIVEKYTMSENLADNVGPGLLQLYSSELGVDDDLKCDVDSDRVYVGNVNTDTDNDVDDNGTKCKQPTSNIHDDIIADINPAASEEKNEGLNNFEVENHTKISPISDDRNEIAEEESDNADAVEDIIVSHENSIAAKPKVSGKDSDVDSGIGYSSACTDVLVPPRGRTSQRESTVKVQPVKGDHSLLPSRMEVDVDILDEVNLVHFSHDLARSHDLIARGEHSSGEERDDTDVRLGISKYVEKEKKIAEKYRRARSPSPYVIRSHLQSASLRPKSAPLFAQSEMDLRAVNISLSSGSVSDMSAHYEQTLQNGEQTLQNKNHSLVSHETSSLSPVKEKATSHSSKKLDFVSKYASMPNLADSDRTHPSSFSSNNMSSKLSKQRKSSVTSNSSYDSSISLLSESESEPVTQIHQTDANGAIYVQNAHPAPHYSRRVIDDRHFKEVDLENFENCLEVQPKSDISGKRGMYKPSTNSPRVTSPRVKEKRLKIRNILKSRKGAFNPPGEEFPVSGEKVPPSRIYAKDRGSNPDSGSLENGSNSTEYGNSAESSTKDLVSAVMGSDPVGKESRNNVRFKDASVLEGKKHVPQSAVNTRPGDTGVLGNIVLGATGIAANVINAKAVQKDSHTKPVNSARQLPNTPTVLDTGGDKQSERVARQLPNPENVINTCNGSSESLDRAVSPSKAQPPKKPARHKNKNRNLPPDLNLSKYKIRSNGEALPAERKMSITSNESSPASLEFPATQNSELSSAAKPAADHVVPRTRTESVESEIQVLETQPSNLQHSKAFGGSKASLKEKVGGIKQATKGKFKAFKKAISMDRGIDSAGTEANTGDQTSHDHNKGGHFGFPKMKKAPSLKSFTSLFSRKKKKGKFTIEDNDNASTRGSSLTISGEPSSGKNRNWVSCQSLPTVDSSNRNGPIRTQNDNHQPIRTKHGIQPMGKVQAINKDGTQTIQLVKPEDGPIGLFIAKGNPKYGNGIFVSRFAATRPEQCFAGLLGVGDEILEVNGHVVRDLTEDAVYHLISASPVVVMKIFPFIARQDV